MLRPVFLSYSTDDTATATSARDHLEAQGIACWMAPRDIAPGNDYGEQIITAIEQARVLLLILSESSNNSVFVRHEVERAVAKGKVIIPFRIQPVQPSRSLEFFISNYQWIDGWDLHAAKTLDALVQAIHGHMVGQAPQLQNSPPSTPSHSNSHSHSPLLSPHLAIPHNLPHQLTRFIGRDSELAAIERLLAEEDARLVTILGPGGMGKTRLSLAVAERHLKDARFVHGVHFIALAPLRDAQHIVFTLAEALSFAIHSANDARTAQQQLLDFLRSKSLLLVFDNFEHLLEGAELVAQILQAAPQVRVLATSRERLRLPGEHLFLLNGLAVDGSDQFAGDTGAAAVQLFLQSARQFQPDMELSGEELVHVVSICHLVGGMPLGIELAAAWIEVLTPQEIASEIRRSLDFLEAERRGGQPHHRSVRAVFDSTWQRLDATEQQVFTRLSVFRGGFTREAAEQVAGASLRLLSTLTGKSLIQHDRERGRYTVHELLRQFGEEKLNGTPQARQETYAALCTYFTTFLQRQEDRLKGREQAAAMSAIDAEIENVRIAWQWAITHRELEAISRSLETLWFFYITKSWLQEGKMIFGLAAETLDMQEPAGRQGIVLGRILARLGSLTSDADFQIAKLGSGKDAEAHYRRSIEILDKLGVRGETGLPRMGLSVVLANSERIELAGQVLREAYEIFKAEHDLWQLGFVFANLSSYSYWVGDYEQAKEYIEQGIAVAEESGHLRTLSGLYTNKASILLVTQEYEAAKLAAEQSLAMSRAIGDKLATAGALISVSEVAVHMGDFAQARQHAEASLALFQEIGLTLSQFAPLCLLGKIEVALGNHKGAKAYFARAIQAYLDNGASNIYLFGEALIGMATIMAKEGKQTLAGEIYEHVLQHPASEHATIMRVAKLRAELAPDVLAAAAGTARPIHALITELLNHSG